MTVLVVLRLQEEWRGVVEQISWSPRAFLYRKLLSDVECDELIKGVRRDSGSNSQPRSRRRPATNPLPPCPDHLCCSMCFSLSEPAQPLKAAVVEVQYSVSRLRQPHAPIVWVGRTAAMAAHVRWLFNVGSHPVGQHPRMAKLPPSHRLQPLA